MQSQADRGKAQISTSTIVAAILAILLAREHFLKVPKWIQSYVAGGLKLLKLQVADGTDVQEESFVRDLKSKDPDSYSMANVALKLKGLINHATEKLNQVDSFSFGDTKTQVAAVMTIKSIQFARENMPDLWEKIHLKSGMSLTFTEEKRKYLFDMLTLADLAYKDETDEIRNLLGSMDDMHLVRHVKFDSPEQVCHYVAINSRKKIAYISVRGTASLSDLVTDALGVPVAHELRSPYAEGKSTTITCHAGILEASIHLANEVEHLIKHLFLPAGYKVMIVGHSLGAGVACITGVLLRSMLPELQVGDKKTLEVVAFATPPVMNYNVGVDASVFMTSVVNNFDIIPRCSMWTVVALLSFLEQVASKLELTSENTANMTPFDLLKLFKDEDTAKLLTGEDIIEGMEQARANFDRNDPHYLFVPGEVIILYQKNPSQQMETPKPTGAVVSDGYATVLGHLIFDEMIVGDHMIPEYEKALLAMT